MIILKNNFKRRASAEYVITILIISVALTGTNSSIQKSYAQTRIGTIAACQQLPIASVTASGNDGNLPANVLDNNLNTRWSNLGVGSFIQADLGEQKTICSVDITWHRGNLRVNNFVISVSNDGTSFTNVFTGKSSGTTLSAEKYSLPTSVTPLFVRVTVNGNTENNWASIIELSVDGLSNTLPPPPPPPPPSHPTADNKTIQTNAGTPVQITLTGTDPISGDVLKFSVIGLPQHGIVTSLAGTLPNTVIYTPNTGFSGTDSFTYKATDGQGVDSNIATVTITVNAPSPPPPAADNKIIQTNKETPIGITLTGTDPIQGDVLRFSVVGNPQHGSVTPGPVSSNVFYTPNTGFIGTDSFTYKATDGQGVDSNIATVSIIVSNATAGGNNLDPFGIREIYPTTPSGEQWFMNMNDPNNDPRTEPQTTLTKNPDGSWKVTGNAVRFNVFTSSGYRHELITTLNQQQLAAKGYMQSPNDWKDIEMTGYVKFNKGDTSDGFTWYARGGHHTGAGFPQGCEGSSIKEELDFAGTTRFEKEQWHVHYVFTPHKPATDSIQGKWVGYKAVMYNVDQIGTTAVKEEIWLDPNDNGNWVKVNEFTDAGGFGDQGQVCGGKPDQIITWGGPIATFRWDKTTDVDIKDFSVREIQSPH
jgi:hypothetical protein